MEEEEKAEEAAGARITKKKKAKGKHGRQAKLTGGAIDSGNSLKETRPSPFAEVVPPNIPEFTTEKKVAGKGRGRVKSEPKLADGESDPKQKKLTFESSDKPKDEGGKAKKPAVEKPSQAKKRKVKEVVDSFIGSSDSEVEVEVEKKSLRERIELRKTKTTDYKEVLSGDESVVSVDSEASWRSGSNDDLDADVLPAIKKAKLAVGGSKTALATGEGEKVSAKLDTAETKLDSKSKKPALMIEGGAEPRGPGKGKKETARSKPTTTTHKAGAKPTGKLTAKPGAKPSTKSGGGTTSSGSGSGSSSGEKKKQGKAVAGKKRVMPRDFESDDELDYSIDSGSGSDSIAIPAKKVATEVCVCVRVRMGGVCVCTWGVCVRVCMWGVCVSVFVTQ